MLISFIPLSILGYVALHISYTGIKELSNSYIYHYITEKKKRVNLFCRDLETIINNIADLNETKILLSSHSSALRNSELQKQIKSEIIRSPLYEGIISVDIFNQEGIVTHVGMPIRHDNLNVYLQKSLIQSVLETKKDVYWVAIQDCIYNTRHHNKVLSGIKPIWFTKKTDSNIHKKSPGFLLLQFDIKIFYNEFNNTNPFGGDSIILDQHSTFVLNPDFKQMGKKAEQPLKELLTKTRVNASHSVHFKDRFIVFDKFLDKNWYIAHVVSDAAYKAKITPIFYYFLVLFFICLCIIVITVFVFNKSILAPIKMITNRFRNLKHSALITQRTIDNKYPDEIGELVHCFNNVIESIIENNKSEVALKESQERFKALHNASFGGIAIHDKGVILECNKGLSTITGYSYNELIGMNGLLLISDETRDKVIHNINIGYEQSYEAEGIRKNGELYPLRLEARVIPYKNKTVRVVEFRDITETKRVADEKEHLENQLRQAQKMEAVGRLAGGVAHDYNNMLSIIIGHTEMALEMTDPSMPIYADLDEIMSAGKRSANLTRQLLAFARKQAVLPKIFDINKTVNEMINMLKRLIGEDIELIWEQNNQFYPIKIDPSQFDQILANLCLNARDAIEGVGRIMIETKMISVDDKFCENHAEASPGTYICLIVSDNGKGMDKITLSNIFEPFFTTKSIGKGTGLGLATVHGIVKQNNGFIIVFSEQDKGTSFHIYFPYELQKETSQISLNSSVDCPGGKETILLVEDEPGILNMITKMLLRLGYNVLSANSPGIAMEIAKNQRDSIHLLITDVIMPEMNGRDLAENIVLLNPDLKYLFMSGYTADVIAHHGVLDAHISFIQKPFSHEELAVKIREIMDN